MNKTIQKVSEETLKIYNLLSSSEPGKEFSYKEIEDSTGVKMNNDGKSKMRSALRKLKMPNETIKGKGIKLLSKENAGSIVAHKVIKVDNAIKKAAKTTKQVSDRVYEQLSEPEKKHLNFVGALFGTIRAYSNSAKKIFQKPQIKQGQEINV